MDGKVDLWEVMAYILGRKTLSGTQPLRSDTRWVQDVAPLLSRLFVTAAT